MAKLVCTLVRGDAEFQGTLHDAAGGPVLAPFHGGRVYRAKDAAGEWVVRLTQRAELPEETALLERARVAGWSLVF
jgi:hypothetical protein